jgi:hypothetical protein
MVRSPRRDHGRAILSSLLSVTDLQPPSSSAALLPGHHRRARGGEPKRGQVASARDRRRVPYPGRRRRAHLLGCRATACASRPRRPSRSRTGAALCQPNAPKVTGSTTFSATACARECSVALGQPRIARSGGPLPPSREVNAGAPQSCDRVSRLGGKLPNSSFLSSPALPSPLAQARRDGRRAAARPGFGALRNQALRAVQPPDRYHEDVSTRRAVCGAPWHRTRLRPA